MVDDSQNQEVTAHLASSSNPVRRYQSTNRTESDPGLQMDNLIDEHEHHHREHGLSIISAAIFVAGELAGSGVLALPKAIVDAGITGILLLVIFCVNAAYSGSKLGECWAILERRYPEYRSGTRNPYPTIALVAVGNWGRLLVSLCIQLTLFGAGTVYLLLASNMVQKFLGGFLQNIPLMEHIGSCSWFLIFAALLCIPMWMGSPRDFRLVGIGALVTTILSCVCILIQIATDGFNNTAPVEHKPHSLEEFFLSFGTILFAFGGASTFPTIQNDMTDRNDFYKSVRIAFVVIILLYLPISLYGYIVYGDSLQPNIIDSLSPSPFTLMAEVFMATHLILAFIIIINPVSQDLEVIFNVPDRFCLKRCVLRTLILCLMVFIGETIPKFNNILSLVGGSTVTLATFVLPPYFYMKLCEQEEERPISLYWKTYMWELILIGIVGGIASSYSAIKTIIADPLSKPCYWPKN